jgi:hypothetical protein
MPCCHWACNPSSWPSRKPACQLAYTPSALHCPGPGRRRPRRSRRKPDVIIDTGDIDQPTYNQLAAIAPTLTQPADNPQDWTWQTQLTWIATALGRSDTAKTLLNDATSQQTKIKSEHPAFSGKSILAVNYTGTTTTAAAQESPPTAYLDGIGFPYSPHYKRGPADPPTSRSTSTISTTSATAPTSCCCCAPTRPPAAADTPACRPTTADTAEFWSSSMTRPPSPHCPPAARRPPPTSTPRWSTNSATKSTDGPAIWTRAPSPRRHNKDADVLDAV